MTWGMIGGAAVSVIGGALLGGGGGGGRLMRSIGNFRPILSLSGRFPPKGGKGGRSLNTTKGPVKTGPFFLRAKARSSGHGPDT